MVPSAVRAKTVGFAPVQILPMSRVERAVQPLVQVALLAALVVAAGREARREVGREEEGLRAVGECD